MTTRASRSGFEGARPRAPSRVERPGSIRHGDLSGADWRFLLPRGDIGRVLLLGAPSAGMLAGVAPLARSVVAAVPARPDVQAVKEVVRSRGLAGVRAVHAPDVRTIGAAAGARLPFRRLAFDLIVLREADLGSLALSPRLIRELVRILASDGTLYLESTGLAAALRLPRRLARLRSRGLGVVDRFWLVHRRGHLRAALPLDPRHPAAAYLFGNVVHGTSKKARALGALTKPALELRLLPWLLPGRGVLLRRSAEGHGSGAAASGGAGDAGSEGAGMGARSADSGDTFALHARGAYDANKVTFFRFPRGARRPDVIVKITRSSAYNHRLEAEHRVLSEVEERRLVPPSSFPRPLFLEYRSGLAALGESVVDGSPFRSVTSARADCPFARQAIEWIVTLGSASAASTPASDLAARFDRLLEETARTYTLSPAEIPRLEAGVDRVRSSASDVPLVFRHGDAGTWNAMVTRAGRIAFLDWEAGEPQGPPLWDLFDFFRSFGSWMGRKRGGGDRLANFRDAFLRPGPLARLQVEAVDRYCAAIDLDRGLVEPLYFTAWMQRALREAEWTSAPLDDGLYINLIRLCLGERGTPLRQGLFE